MSKFKKTIGIMLAVVMTVACIPMLPGVSFGKVEAGTTPTPNYLTFTANEDGCTIWFNYADGTDVEYATGTNVNGEIAVGGWTTYSKETPKGKDTERNAIQLNSGQCVQFRAIGVESDKGNYFVMTGNPGSIDASGSVTSLTDGNGGNPNVKLTDWCYLNMFNGCVQLATAPELPATTLAAFCYADMFRGCTELRSAPKLPATTLAPECYQYMFSKCTNLENAPELPATELRDGCYSCMFMDCEKLKKAPALPATMLKVGCYTGMFAGCASLTSMPKLPATELVESCYSDMFAGCTSLTNSTALPATALAKNCYEGMFYGCTSLTNIPELPATELKEGCYKKMFYNCKGLTSLQTLPATTLAESCYEDMFGECTGLTSLPTLPATTLAKSSYKNMFNGCTGIDVSTDKTGDYKFAWSIPQGATAPTDSEKGTEWNKQMLLGTTGSFNASSAEDPQIGTTYYQKTATVSFESNGGTRVPSQATASKLVKPVNPTKNNDEFCGWYTDETYTKAWDFDNDKVTGNITLYARWKNSYEQNLENQIATLQARISELVASGNASAKEIAELQAQVKTLTEQIKALEAEKTTKQSEIDNLKSENEKLANELATIKFKEQAVKGLSVKAAKKSITIKCKAVADASGYRVYYKDKTARNAKAVYVTSTEPTVKLSKLKSGHVYAVKIRAISEIGGKTVRSQWSSLKTVKAK